jgi:hypothetical protein
MWRKETHHLAQLRTVALDQRHEPRNRPAVTGTRLLDEPRGLDLACHAGLPSVLRRQAAGTWISKASP